VHVQSSESSSNPGPTCQPAVGDDLAIQARRLLQFQTSRAYRQSAWLAELALRVSLVSRSAQRNRSLSMTARRFPIVSMPSSKLEEVPYRRLSRESRILVCLDCASLKHGVSPLWISGRLQPLMQWVLMPIHCSCSVFGSCRQDQCHSSWPATLSRAHPKAYICDPPSRKLASSDALTVENSSRGGLRHMGRAVVNPANIRRDNREWDCSTLSKLAILWPLEIRICRPG